MKAELLLALVAIGCGRVGFDAESTTDAAVSTGLANRAFVTSLAYPGNLGGVAGGDALCMQHAANAGMTGTFVAWLGAANAPPFARLAGSRGWQLVDGTPLADRADDFITRSLIAPFALDETGVDVRLAMADVWTGMTSVGDPALDCTSWTSNSNAVMGQTGDPAFGGSAYIARSTSTCDVPRRLYCLELGSVSTVVVDRVPGRIAFVSASVWIANPKGIASADAVCQHEATDAGLRGTFKAYLGTNTMAPASRFSRTGPPWKRVDGTLIAPTAEDMFTAPYHTNFIDRTADGTINVASFWSGLPDTVSTGSECADWTDPASTSIVRYGDPTTTSTPTFFVDNSIGCNDVRRLLCLQQ